MQGVRCYDQRRLGGARGGARVGACGGAYGGACSPEFGEINPVTRPRSHPDGERHRMVTTRRVSRAGEQWRTMAHAWYSGRWRPCPRPERALWWPCAPRAARLMPQAQASRRRAPPMRALPALRPLTRVPNRLLTACGIASRLCLDPYVHRGGAGGRGGRLRR